MKYPTAVTPANGMLPVGERAYDVASGHGSNTIGVLSSESGSEKGLGSIGIRCWPGFGSWTPAFAGVTNKSAYS